MSSYLAPTYFPNSYFFLGGASETSPAGVASVRDRDVYQRIMEEVEGIGEFSSVVYLLPGSSLEFADRNPILGVMPKGWEEAETGDGVSLLRTVQYQLWVVVRDQEAQARYDWGDRLACLVQNRLDGSSLGGLGIPALSVLRGGTVHPSKGLDALTLILEGRFVYELGSSSGRGTLK